MQIALLAYVSSLLMVWAIRICLLHWTLTRDLRLKPDTFQGPPSPAPSVSVMIAARDEEDNIARCLESLLKQDYPDFEIIVVDDRSTDRTAEIVQEFSHRDARVRLIRNSELPKGWTGKNHALHLAVKEARGEFYLFTDADIRHCPSSITQSMAFAVGNNVDMLSHIIRLENISFWAKMLQPMLGGMLAMQYPLWQVNNPKRKLAYANGQYILVRREAYERIGGRESVRGEFMDIGLGRRIKEAGLKLRVTYGPHLAQSKAYDTLRQICRAWSRIFYGGFRASLPRMTFMVLMLLVFSISPYAVLIGSALAVASGGAAPLTWAIFIMSIAAIIVQQGAVLMFYRACGSPGKYVLLYFFTSLIALGILISSIAIRFSSRGIVWKGIAYRARA